MATITLQCTHCNKPFEKNSNEIARRKFKANCKLSNWFCSRSCSASHGNKNRKLVNPPGPQYGNKYRQRWHPEISWYMKRICHDHRSKCKLEESKEDLHDHLMSIWTGKCGISGKIIKRRDCYGKTATNNPFEIASVDRINNNKGYVVGNLRWICLALNLARQDLDAGEFDEYFQKFVE